MMRIAGTLLLAAALGFPGAALADVTARYAIGDGKQTLVVEVDDGGYSRIGVDNVFSLIHRDGVDYVAIEVKGEKLVARLDDAIQAMKGQMASAAIADGGNGPLFVIGGGGATQVGGRAATSWTLGPKGTEKEKALEIALSADPELAPVGAALRHLADAGLAVFEGVAFPASSQVGPRLHELLAKGTPIRVAPLMELRSVDHQEIDAHRFDLPAPVTSAEELAKAMGPPATPSGPAAPLQPLP